MTSTREILIVDDTAANIEVLSGLLGDYRQRVAMDGATALRLVQARSPDLVLLDVMMPNMDGFEVCRRLRANPGTAEIPVIFITALGEVQNETLGFEVGGVDYITKPFNARVVRARVQTHIELKQVRDGLRDEKARLEARVEERTSELRIALERLRRSAIDTVLRLGLAAEYRDDQTGGHVLRMAHYAVSVARELGWDTEDLDRLFHAALMHDIGKLALPDTILHKTGPLNDSEWTIIKRHPLVGARILSGSDSDIIQLAEIVALTHHEKWDGSGYPYGLQEQNIPLVGRIVAICDVFDALTVCRPYKEALPFDKACSIIRLGSGGHFDPAVVHAFFTAEPEVRRIHHLYGNDSSVRPLAPAIKAARDAHPSSPNITAIGEQPKGDTPSLS
jgi:putative two-component system response regulator